MGRGVYVLFTAIALKFQANFLTVCEGKKKRAKIFGDKYSCNFWGDFFFSLILGIFCLGLNNFVGFGGFFGVCRDFFEIYIWIYTGFGGIYPSKVYL